MNIAIFEEHIQTKKCTIVKDSKEEENFANELINTIKRLNMENIPHKEALENIMHTFVNHIERIWYKHSKIINIPKHSKAWWNEDCYRNLEKYRQTKRIDNWK